MNNRLCSPRTRKLKSIRPAAPVQLPALALFVACLALPGLSWASWASDAPDWLRAQISAPLPAHDQKTDAVMVYSESVLTVQADGRLKRLDRRAYRILRPEGRAHGLVRVYVDSQTRVTGLHGWCIPADGKVFEVKAKDAVESAVLGVDDGYLMSDVQTQSLQIPATEPGNLIGYEIEQELHPYAVGDEWDVQETVPVRETHYTLQLPSGWSYKAVWINSPEVAAVASGNSRWNWVVTNLEPVKIEEDMPPWRGIAARMVVSLIAPGGQELGFRSWHDLGAWYLHLASDRRNVDTEIKQKVAALTVGIPGMLGKMRALAAFVQNDIRYVGIELGIGGHQPHPAAEVLAHGYGDCKDKVTLLSAMFKELGIESYYVAINTTRGSVTTTTPPNLDFNHMIIAVAVPAAASDPALIATIAHPKLGSLLFFDPTDSLTPFGALRGGLQANFGLLISPDDGELVKLPQLSSDSNGIHRVAKMTLDADGTLHGEIQEIWSGDPAARQRFALRATTQDIDRIKPAEKVAAEALSSFHFEKAAIRNLHDAQRPFEWNYSLVADHYAKLSGGLLLLRPRILGSKSSALLEGEEPRRQPVEFDGPQRDSDEFDIALPAGFSVDELPPPIHADYGFALYQSESKVVNQVLRYTRSFEIKQLSVPTDKLDELKSLYRLIYGDERRMAVLKPAGS